MDSHTHTVLPIPSAHKTAHGVGIRITFKHGRLHIHDLDRLKQHAEFSGDYLQTSFAYRASPGDLDPAVRDEV